MPRNFKFSMALAAVIPFLLSCTAPDKARQVLIDNGYTNIQITGYAFFYCGKDDDFSTGFTATSPYGTSVKGAVCSGVFKGSTIRF